MTPSGLNVGREAGSNPVMVPEMPFSESENVPVIPVTTYEPAGRLEPAGTVFETVITPEALMLLTLFEGFGGAEGFGVIEKL